jgi:hypothetical protein
MFVCDHLSKDEIISRKRSFSRANAAGNNCVAAMVAHYDRARKSIRVAGRRPLVTRGESRAQKGAGRKSAV